MNRTVAAFDFDGTLTRRDTLLPYLARVAGRGRVARGLVRALPSMRADRDAAKEQLLAILAGREMSDLSAHGQEYGAFLVERKIRPDMRERVAWHRREGHDIVIVSASLDVYLATVADGLGVDALLCTTLEADGGVCTGRMLGGNCRGPAKAERLLSYLGAGDVTLWAYGDSDGDREMLALAHHPVRV